MMLWLLLACASKELPAPPDPPHPPQEVQEAPKPDSAKVCMDQCMRQNMARAVHHSVIEADCKKACDATKTRGLKDDIQLK